MDRGGMRPDALNAACERWRPRAVFLVPSLHNPTAITLAEERRQALVTILRRHNVLIIEDDVYRPLLDEELPSFASLEPELTIYISGLSKCVAPGLRLGFVVAPRALVGDVGGAADRQLDGQPSHRPRRHPPARGWPGRRRREAPEGGDPPSPSHRA
jgi:DNA-binding transcriptional MocR family regulator